MLKAIIGVIIGIMIGVFFMTMVAAALWGDDHMTEIMLKRKEEDTNND